MGGFYCPTCQAVRHISEGHERGNTLADDRCWKCGTLVYSPAEAERLQREIDDDG